MGWLRDNRNAVYVSVSLLLAAGTWTELRAPSAARTVTVHSATDDSSSGRRRSSGLGRQQDLPLPAVALPHSDATHPPPLLLQPSSPAAPLPQAPPQLPRHPPAPAPSQASISNPEACQFTHVFSPYNTADGALLDEYHLAEQSWVQAAGYAAGAVVVTFVAAVLAEDRGAVPSFATAVEITESVGSLPTIGGILAAGQDASKRRGAGGYLVFTNWDISVTTTFYQNMCSAIKDELALSNENGGGGGGGVGWLALDVTRLDVKASAEELQNLPPLAELDTPTGVGTFLLEHGSKHPGHDCFVIPAALDISCFTASVGFVVSQPPWGKLLRSILQGTASKHGSEGKFGLLRSSAKKGVYTYHFTNADKPAAWKNGFEAHFELHIFQISQAFRILYNPDKMSSSKVAVSRLLEQSAYLHHLTVLQATACAYAGSGGSSGGKLDGAVPTKPAPLCHMCSAAFTQAGILSKIYNQKVTREIEAGIRNVTKSTAEMLRIPRDLPSGSIMVGGEYACSGEMPQCATLRAGSCTETIKREGTCSFS